MRDLCTATKSGKAVGVAQQVLGCRRQMGHEFGTHKREKNTKTDTDTPYPGSPKTRNLAGEWPPDWINKGVNGGQIKARPRGKLEFVYKGVLSCQDRFMKRRSRIKTTRYFNWITNTTKGILMGGKIRGLNDRVGVKRVTADGRGKESADQ